MSSVPCNLFGGLIIIDESREELKAGRESGRKVHQSVEVNTKPAEDVGEGKKL
jgi:hypothetical protein